MKTRFFIPVLIGMTLISACASPTPAPRMDAGVASASAAPAAPAIAPSTNGAAPIKAEVAAQIADEARMVIRTAQLTLVVNDTQAAANAAQSAAVGLNGFVQTSSVSNKGNLAYANLVLKVPSDQFDNAMSQLRKLALEVRDERVSGQDVTAEYADLDAQMRNLETAEKQLREIMAKTDKTEDVIKVFNELTRVRGEIERAKGRMQFLSRSVAMATINVSITPNIAEAPIQPTKWQPIGELKRAFESLVNSLQGLGTLVIWFVVSVLPVLLILGAPLYLIARLLGRRRVVKPKIVEPTVK